MKIISLVPSITETLFDFGLTSNEIIGRTKFCIHPENLVKEVEVIGGTKNLNIEKIRALNPELIIANKEENEKLQVEELSKEFKVWVTDIQNLEDNSMFITDLGKLLKKPDLARNFNESIDGIFSEIKVETPKKVAYLIWKNPYMTIGSDTFIHDVISKIGFQNIFSAQKRYPVISLSDFHEAEYIFLSTEPYPFKQKHIEEFQAEFPSKKITLVDGEAFSWFGTHLTKKSEYLQRLAKL
ncbi:iron ABC transporter [Kaistella solincola]|uniref:Iron ABC transporter n=1 Tax=Kaistella solincola TaxID=510955 RepID=A0ABR4ZNW4_9FLAO|nr:helical backbone metal receptor [Kaistella solincola]KIA83022.1 iron ABC transporter [Kaistella solincola]